MVLMEAKEADPFLRSLRSLEDADLCHEVYSGVRLSSTLGSEIEFCLFVATHQRSSTSTRIVCRGPSERSAIIVDIFDNEAQRLGSRTYSYKMKKQILKR